MKLVTMAAGAASVSFPSFLLVLVTGRLVRFLVMSYVARVFGKRMHEWYVSGNKRAVYVSIACLGAVLLVAYLTVRAIIF